MSKQNASSHGSGSFVKILDSN